tara:strand:+ start:232 stop:528 length:297 start_codon:yes stop_codon:yes gene_type:complete
MNSDTNVNPEDFSDAEHAAVDAMAAPIIEHFEGEKKADKKFNSRNRSAWHRMNRPEKTDRIDKGYQMIDRLMDRGLAKNPIRKPTNEGVEAEAETQGM